MAFSPRVEGRVRPQLDSMLCFQIKFSSPGALQGLVHVPISPGNTAIDLYLVAFQRIRLAGETLRVSCDSGARFLPVMEC